MKGLSVNEKRALYEARADLLRYMKSKIDDEYRWYINDETTSEEDKASARCRVEAYEAIANEI